MPPNRCCPACLVTVPDWHFEWHTNEDQKKIFDGQATMQCPFCNSGVFFDGFEMKPGDPEKHIAARDIFKAATWAFYNAGDNTLSGYLQTEQGQPYKSLWPIEDVRLADSKTVLEQK